MERALSDTAIGPVDGEVCAVAIANLNFLRRGTNAKAVLIDLCVVRVGLDGDMDRVFVEQRATARSQCDGREEEHRRVDQVLLPKRHSQVVSQVRASVYLDHLILECHAV